ncbi:MAG: hypothetical protein ICV54_01345 [Nostoc sp. C3-bin3]|nr:hypothetical protein [Nostoc sp. C3-bin3]
MKLIFGQVAFSLGILLTMSKGALVLNLEVTQATKDLEQSDGFACANAELGKRKILKAIAS